MKDYLRRFGEYHKYMESLGVKDKHDHPYYSLLPLAKFNLDYGLLYLHKHAFQPAIELLGTDE